MPKKMPTDNIILFKLHFFVAGWVDVENGHCRLQGDCTLWEATCLQTFVVGLRLTVIALKQIFWISVLKSLGFLVDSEWNGFKCKFLYNMNFCLCKQLKICN